MASPGVVLRAANQHLNDCRWQTYHNSLAVERSETDEDRRNVSTINAVRKNGTILKPVPSYLTALRLVSCRRSSSAPPLGAPFPRGEGLGALNFKILTVVSAD